MVTWIPLIFIGTWKNAEKINFHIIIKRYTNFVENGVVQDNQCVVIAHNNPTSEGRGDLKLCKLFVWEKIPFCTKVRESNIFLKKQYIKLLSTSSDQTYRLLNWFQLNGSLIIFNLTKNFYLFSSEPLQWCCKIKFKLGWRRRTVPWKL